MKEETSLQDTTDIKMIIKDYYKQLVSTLNSLDEMVKFLERHKLLAHLRKKR